MTDEGESAYTSSAPAVPGHLPLKGKALATANSQFKLLIFQASDTRKLQTLEELERCAAAGGDVSHLVCVAELLNSCCGVAAADDGDSAGLCYCLCNGACTGSEVFPLGNAHRTVPDNGACAADSLSDSISTAAVLAATLIAHFCHVNLDGVIGLLVALFILYSGWNLAKETISPLLGEGASQELLAYGYTDKDISSNVKAKIGDWYISGEMSKSEAEKALVKYTDEKAKDINSQMLRWTYVKQKGFKKDADVYKPFFQAVETGDNLRTIIREMTSYGYEKSDLAGRITSQYKDKYITLYRTNRVAATNLKARLLTAYAALGYSRSDKNKDIDAWLKKKN